MKLLVFEIWIIEITYKDSNNCVSSICYTYISNFYLIYLVYLLLILWWIPIIFMYKWKVLQYPIMKGIIEWISMNGNIHLLITTKWFGFFANFLLFLIEELANFILYSYMYICISTRISVIKYYFKFIK